MVKYEEWTKYAQEIEGLHINLSNFTVILMAIHNIPANMYIVQCTCVECRNNNNIVFKLNLFQSQIGTVERNINGMLQYQSFSRSSEARDHALLIDNNRYVQNWSIIQIVVILLTCSIQVSYNAFIINRFYCL